MSVRVVDGEKYTVGYSPARLMVAIDLGKMLNRLGGEIGRHRQERFADWVCGNPVDRLGRVEQTQLKADVLRMSELAISGGYGSMLGRRDG